LPICTENFSSRIDRKKSAVREFASELNFARKLNPFAWSNLIEEIEFACSRMAFRGTRKQSTQSLSAGGPALFKVRTRELTCAPGDLIEEK
jgi:hypothetical protein